MVSVEDLIKRRATLSVTQNPDRKLDYIVTLDAHPPDCGGKTCHMTLRYVPDRYVLDAAAFGDYLNAAAGVVWNTPEDLAVTVLGDVNDRIIPRWVHVSFSITQGRDCCVDTHTIVIEDRQPGWDNENLLQRLARI